MKKTRRPTLVKSQAQWEKLESLLSAGKISATHFQESTYGINKHQLPKKLEGPEGPKKLVSLLPRRKTYR